MGLGKKGCWIDRRFGDGVECQAKLEEYRECLHNGSSCSTDRHIVIRSWSFGLHCEAYKRNLEKCFEICAGGLHVGEWFLHILTTTVLPFGRSIMTDMRAYLSVKRNEALTLRTGVGRNPRDVNKSEAQAAHANSSTPLDVYR